MRFRDSILAVLVALMWGSAFVIIELGLREFPPIFNAALRFACASIPFIFFIRRDGIEWRWIAAIGASFVCMFSLMYVGMKMGTPAGLTSLVLQSQVLFAILLSALVLRDFPNGWQMAGLILGLAGIALIAFGMGDLSKLAALGLVIASAFFYGSISVLMKLAGRVNMLSLIVWVSLIPPIPLLGLSILLETGQMQALVNMSRTGLTSVLYTAIFGTVIPFALWGKLLRSYPTHIVAPFALLVPVFGMLMASVFLGESFGKERLFASGLILAGLVTIVSEKRLTKVVRHFLPYNNRHIDIN